MHWHVHDRLPGSEPCGDFKSGKLQPPAHPQPFAELHRINIVNDKSISIQSYVLLFM